jgi:putative intracellular protease/amidase
MKKIVKLLPLALAVLLQLNGYSQDNQSLKNKKVLIVVTSTGEVKSTDAKTGLWIEEFATPYYLLKEKGVDVTIASPKGGKSPIDPRSTLPDFRTDAVKRFLGDTEAQDALNHTVPLIDVHAKDYDAVFYSGGHGPMWDLPDNRYSIRLIESLYNSGKPIAFVCHGPVALKNVKTKDGSLLIKGKKVAGYANTEEDAGKTRGFVPFLLEDMLRAAGANYVKGPDWHPFAVSDGQLITGQNPASAAVVTEKLITALSAQRN